MASCDLKIHNGTDDSAVYSIIQICGEIRHSGVGILTIEMPQWTASHHRRVEKYFGYMELTDNCLALNQTDIVTLETFGLSTTILMTKLSIPFVIPIVSTRLEYTKKTSFQCQVSIFYQHMLIPSDISVSRSCRHDEIQVYLRKENSFIIYKKTMSYYTCYHCNLAHSLPPLGISFLKVSQLDSTTIIRRRV